MVDDRQRNILTNVVGMLITIFEIKEVNIIT